MATKFLVGVATNEATTLVIEGKVGAKAPDVLIVDAANNRRSEPYTPSDARWTIPLGAGTYVLRLETTPATDFDGPVAASVDGRSGPVTFFVRIGLDRVIAWSATKTLGGGNPKDPWPPPHETTAVDDLTRAWFAKKLYDEDGTPTVTRDGPLSYGAPALDAPLTPEES